MAANIVLAVRETQYIEPLLHYIHHSEYGEMLNIKAFSRMEVFTEYMKGGEVPDAVVGEPAFIEAWLVGGRAAVPWAILEEAGGAAFTENKGAAGGKRIAKYQALPALLSSMLQLCEVRRNRTAFGLGEGTLLLGIVSGSGSSGKTTVAMNLAKQFGCQGLSVFYLNLETVNSSGLFLHPSWGKGPGLERLLYEIQVSKDRGHASEIGIRRYAVRLDALHCDTFRPVSNVKEMVHMSAGDAQELMELLAGDGGYDIVIVDTGSIGEERAGAVLQCCGRLVWVLRDDEVGVYKTERWLSHFTSPHSGMTADLSGKSLFAVNFARENVPQIPFTEGIEPDVLLPFISSWNLPNRGELSLNSPVFQRGIQKLCGMIAGMPQPELQSGGEGNS
ncbi:AAA domain-containing protein [Paenibacillus sophorae]|uniref:AAA domain-containing protein n=1 Tax=Paenibacillus sophorae TaxID=1333845 RepID=A0A1H8LD20_9BACL|nr:hypothetical protein [Paenibacillus sophorae]QWU17333.1 hypothetical protein KP014_09375 [Paenibacillus sophorae]SEO02939.1 AAA domain-containing protein [Paenibacillus sophorae]